MMVFLPTEPFRRWLAAQSLRDRAMPTLAGLVAGAWLML